ncbi:hypothetical protein BU17DRAFT_61862 [Hysterangium stoloniferum]|nr:hypothetical protein BU17DRAFT_61862 [Hysterangium stoloniferum]
MRTSHRFWLEKMNNMQYARSLFNTPIMTVKQQRDLGAAARERQRQREEQKGELIEIVARMIRQVEKTTDVIPSSLQEPNRLRDGTNANNVEPSTGTCELKKSLKMS